MLNVAFDCETVPFGRQYVPESDTPKANRSPAPKLVVMSYSTDDDEAGLLEPEEAAHQWLEWLRDDEVRLIGHNLSFDMFVMARAAEQAGHDDVIEAVLEAAEAQYKAHNRTGRLSDTRLRERLIDLPFEGDFERGYGLARLEKKYVGRDRSDEKDDEDSWRLRYHHLDGVPLDEWPADARQYALDDARGTLDVWKGQTRYRALSYGSNNKAVVNSDGVMNESLQVSSSIWFQLTTIWGLTTDPSKTIELHDHFKDKASSLEAKMEMFGFHDGTSRNDNKIREWFASAFEQLDGVEPVWTDGGKVSKSKDARRRLRENGIDDPRLDLLEEYNRAIKMNSTYLDPLRAAYPYKVAPQYDALKKTGRSSSKRPNIQNVPAHSDGRGPEIRECFIPRDDHVFVGADYSSLELCTLAQACINLDIESRLAQAINAGKDCHLLVASNLLEMPYEEAVAIYDDPDHDRHKDVSNTREVSKIANYGFPTGMGSDTFVDHAAGRGKKLTPEQSSRVRKAWMSAWPGVRTYFQSYIPEQRFYVECDRKYVVEQHGPKGQTEDWRIRSTPGFCEACNTLFQGLASDGAKNALRLLLRECYVDEASPLYGYRVCAFIHDEFLLEGPRDGASEAAERLSTLMEAGMEVYTPDVEIEAEPELSSRWSKKAEPRRDDDGNLLVWGEDYK
jgi:DNA polymerase I-like protein with 3'-5' exonuclease and polymerase domains